VGREVMEHAMVVIYVYHNVLSINNGGEVEVIYSSLLCGVVKVSIETG
jgi:hypothetical protein